MKLISWNVNGLRACIQKNFMESFQMLDADVVCLQETKLQEGQVTLDMEGYYQYWNYAEKKGYSGTAIFTRQKPFNVTYGIGVKEHDREGRVITLEYADYFLITVYVPNSQNELARLPYRMEWEAAFLVYLKKLEERKPVIFCGDLNVAQDKSKKCRLYRRGTGLLYKNPREWIYRYLSLFLSGTDGHIFLVVVSFSCQREKCRMADRLFLRVKAARGKADRCEDPYRYSRL